MPGAVCEPIQAKLEIGAVGDPLEKEADRIADRVVQSAGPAPIPASIRSVVASAGAPLDEGARAFMEPRFGRSFADVRIHDGPIPSQSAASIGARAYTVGSHIVFRGGAYAPTTLAGRHLLAHELAHVAQASADTQAPLRRKEQGQDEDHPEDAAVSLGALDSATFGYVAEQLLGDTAGAVLREFLRGSKAGLLSAPPAQITCIVDKFSDAGMKDNWEYGKGLLLGTVEGVWVSIKGLFDAIWTLVKLPYEAIRFVTTTLPDLAVKYEPQIEKLVAEGPAIEARVQEVVAAFLRDPQKVLSQASKLVEAMKGAALGKVRSMGRATSGRVLAFLDEPWFEFGRDVGKVFGQVLFEVILAVASDFIGNIVKEAVAITARIAARVTTGIVDALRGVGRLVRQAMVWLESIGAKLLEGAGEVLGGLKGLLKSFAELIDGLLGESAIAETAGGGRVAVAHTPTVLESRAVRPPGGPTVADLTPPKVHPSNVEPGLGTASKTETALPRSRTKIPDVEGLSPELAAQRRQILESFAKFVEEDPAFKSVRKADPNAKIGAQGSVVRGKVGNRRKSTFGQPFDAKDFDVDLFVVSEKIPRPEPNHVVALAGLRDRLVRQYPFLEEGLREGGKGLSVKIFRPGEHIADVFIIFEKP